jgi:DNA-binding LacI/PurR family transcriptional regulator
MTEKQVADVAREAFVHPRTVYRWLREPGGCTESVRLRIELAMKRLKVKK